MIDLHGIDTRRDCHQKIAQIHGAVYAAVNEDNPIHYAMDSYSVFWSTINHGGVVHKLMFDVTEREYARTRGISNSK